MGAITERFARAVAYASRIHAEQTRKSSGSPYLSHLLGVAALVMDAGGDEDECVAALLHDAVEDQGGARTAEQIRLRFGAKVARIVQACSEDREAHAAWIDRKRAAIRKVASADSSALLVLTADKLHNVQSLRAEYRRQGDGVWTHFNGGREGALWYFRAVASAIRAAGGSALVGELDEAVRGLEREVGQSRAGPPPVLGGGRR